MWCRSCQQDVPAVASADDGVRCARCHTDFSAPKSADVDDPTTVKPETDAPLAPGTTDLSADAAFRSWESWEFAEDLRAADRMVNSLGIRRIDAAHEFRNDAATSNQRSPSKLEEMSSRSTTQRSPRMPRRGSFLTWAILSLGLMSFAFGAVLLGWSFWMGRADLWQLGMPFTLAGQAAMVVGLVLQLDSLWRSNQAATESLNELDDQLGELRRATTLLTSSHSGPSQSFYSHMASGAGPHLLLADLKGQLDLLAMKMSDEQR